MMTFYHEIALSKFDDIFHRVRTAVVRETVVLSSFFVLLNINPTQK